MLYILLLNVDSIKSSMLFCLFCVFYDSTGHGLSKLFANKRQRKQYKLKIKINVWVFMVC